MSVAITRPPFIKESEAPINISPVVNMTSSEERPLTIKDEEMKEVQIKEAEIKEVEIMNENIASEDNAVISVETNISKEEEYRFPANNISLESFVTESKVSIKFGIIGLGQAGGKIADAFAACRLPGKDTATYPALAINTCVADLQALKNIPLAQRVQLPKYHLGAMRQPEIGYEAITQPGALDDIMDRVNRVFDDIVDHVIVTGGIGGGTATGTVQVVCEALVQKGYPVTAMITLPRNSDSLEEKKNACDFLGAFQELLLNGIISSAIVVDNNLLYERYNHRAKTSGTDADWKLDSNTEIVRIINELNATTGLASEDTFDGAELTKILSSGGCVTFGKATIELPDEGFNEMVALNLDDILHHGYLANYDNLSEARYAGVQVIHPPRIEFGTMLERTILNELKQEMPTLLGTYLGHARMETERNVLIYTIVSGMGLPGRSQELVRLLQAEADRMNEAEAKRTTFSSVEVTIRSPYQKGGPKTKLTANPFAKK